MMTNADKVSIESTSSLCQPSTSFDIMDFQGFEKSQVWNNSIHCDACEYKASSRPLMLVHIEMRHTLNPACDTATSGEKEEGDDPTPHHSHLDKSLRRMYFNCGECGYKTTSYRSLAAHHHAVSHSSTAKPSLKRKRNITKTDEQMEKSVLICALCGHQTKNADHMKMHQKFHSKISAFTCPICSFSVLTQNRLTYHMNRVHPTYKVIFYLQDICPKTGSVFSLLNPLFLYYRSKTVKIGRY